MSFLKKIKLYSGLGGVDHKENALAQKLGYWFEYPMIIAASWIPIQVYLETVNNTSFSPTFEWAIWALFLIEALVILSVADHKAKYLKQNWLNVVIIIFGFPGFWSQTPLPSIARALRLFYVVALLSRFFTIADDVFQKNHLGVTLLFGFVFIFISGAALYQIDPAVKTLTDGFWWALVTITTVGYGDIAPTSGYGRILASVLIILGVVLFSLLTANISAFLIGKNRKQSNDVLIDKINQLEEKLSAIESKMDNKR